MAISEIKTKILGSKLFKDSFWSIFGNGLGNVLLLFAGIIIARLLGSDLYGKYGMVKSTMFYISSFASLGLGITSTKYVAQHIAVHSQYVRAIINSCTKIAFIFSLILAISLFALSTPLACWLGDVSLSYPLRYLGIIVICRAINITQIGILGGMKQYQKSGRNNIISGLIMLFLCIPLAYYYSLEGALLSLLISQILFCVLNHISINKLLKTFSNQETRPYLRELITFSIPVALQESSYIIVNWGGILLLTKLSGTTEVGLYTAAALWASVILFIPGLLNNVALSHLSSHNNNSKSQLRVLSILLVINIISTLIPFSIVWILSPWIEKLYGSSFVGLSSVMSILTFGVVFQCCSNVLRSYFISHGKNWLIFTIRSVCYCIFFYTAYTLIKKHAGINGALYYSYACILCDMLIVLGQTIGAYLLIYKNNSRTNIPEHHEKGI